MTSSWHRFVASHARGLAATLLMAAVVGTVAGCSPTNRPAPKPTEVWAWGENTRGQLGDGTTTARTVPTRLPGLDDIDHIAAGRFFSLVLRRDATVWQWGTQCTTSSLSPRALRQSLVPVEVPFNPSFKGARSIAAGALHGLAVTKSGAVVGWGYDEHGQLARPWGGSGIINTATQVDGDPTRIISLAGGGTRTVALQLGPPQQTVWTWGSGPIVICLANDPLCAGLGVSTPDMCTVPTGADFCCTGGCASCGNPGPGACCFCPSSTDVYNCRRKPAQIPGFNIDVIDIAAGAQHSVALKADGTVWAWGDNFFGQLGTSGSLPASSSAPLQVVGREPSAITSVPVRGIRRIASSGNHTLALASDGRVWTWGSNQNGQLGRPFLSVIGSASPVVGPTGTGFLRDVVAIAAGAQHSLAITSDGGVWAWGENAFGQLGAATGMCVNGAPPVPCSTVPIRVATVSGAREVAAGERHSLVLVVPP